MAGGCRRRLASAPVAGPLRALGRCFPVDVLLLLVVHRPHVEHDRGSEEKERARPVVAAHRLGPELLELAIVGLHVPPLVVQLVDVESGCVDDHVGQVCCVEDVHLFLLSLLVGFGLFDNDERERVRIPSRPYGALGDGIAGARDVLAQRLLDGGRAHCAHDKVLPALERLHDGHRKEPAVEHGDQGLDAPPRAVVEELADDVALCPLGVDPRGGRAHGVVRRRREQGRVRLDFAGPVLGLGADHVLVLRLSVVRDVVDVYDVDHGLGHYAGAPCHLHLGIEHEIAPLLYLLGALRSEEPEEPLVGWKPDLAPGLELDLLVGIFAYVGPERGNGGVGAYVVAHHVRYYGCHVKRAEQRVSVLREGEAEQRDQAGKVRLVDLRRRHCGLLALALARLPLAGIFPGHIPGSNLCF